jgi:hypothetical protein
MLSPTRFIFLVLIATLPLYLPIFIALDNLKSIYGMAVQSSQGPSGVTTCDPSSIGGQISSLKVFAIFGGLFSIFLSVAIGRSLLAPLKRLLNELSEILKEEDTKILRSRLAEVIKAVSKVKS